jgi:hypothetical protein
MRRFGYLVPLLAGLAIASCSSDDGTELPSTFGDCASPPCEVALEAFTQDPGTLPYCSSNKDAVDLSCPAASGAHTGTCGDKWALRYVYGFPGDFYECIYDASTGLLVGAKWSPDNHPTQFAGEPLPASCQLTAVCDVTALAR